METARLNWLWRGWLVAGVTTTAVYSLAPLTDLAADLVYDGLAFSAGVLVLVGVTLHKPARAAIWYWFAAALFTWLIGDLLWSVHVYVLDTQPYPSIADVFYFGGYPLLVAGLLTLVPRFWRDRAGMLDASIVAAAGALLLWTFVMRPVVSEPSQSILERGIGLGYPVADLVLLAVLARVLTGMSSYVGSLCLLGAAVLTLLAGDIGFSLLQTIGYDGALVDVGFGLSYVAWAAAALHPSMRTLSRPVPATAVGLTWRRMAVLGCCMALTPGLLILQGLLIPGGVDGIGIGIGAGVLVLLVSARMLGLIGTVQRQADQLSTLAMHDDLTGLPNRRLFEQRVRASLAQRLQVALVDLDDFKLINDRLGHAVGDRVVVAVARRLTGALRAADTVARLGGDEFAVLLPDTDPEEAEAVLARVRAVMGRPLTAGQHRLLIQASIGVADGANTDDPFEVLRRADVAMYAAKDLGKNQVARYRPELDHQANEHARIGAELRQAIDEEQFILLYQPIVELPDGPFVGVEALLRWRHPRRGMVDPQEFIEVAERNGLVVPIGDWVLRRACRQAVSWRKDLGPAAPDKVSVNVSVRQLMEPGFADVVAGVLAETGLPPQSLVVEVTESAVFSGGRALAAVNAIHELGVLIALDDFGTGQSSLGLLQTCPVDILKVDKVFIDKITSVGRHKAIPAALITLSDELGLFAVAEGVETAEQARELHQLGYRLAQGYLFGRPMLPELISIGERMVRSTP